MPTLQCTSCGATYYTAATDPHLALAPLIYGCQSCGSREPLDIGVISAEAHEVATGESLAANGGGRAVLPDGRAPGAA